MRPLIPGAGEAAKKVTVVRRARAIALILGVAYLAGAALPCPPQPGVAGGHAHAEHALGAGAWCESSLDVRFLLPVCPCGCSKRATTVAGRLGTVLPPSPVGAPGAPAGAVRLLPDEGPRAPAPPARAVDHVPLPA
jgi:hypothetical protein